jgi:alkylhydroperoxidase/carboxymuconolactone decarboxylase family protein YurZ
MAFARRRPLMRSRAERRHPDPNRILQQEVPNGSAPPMSTPANSRPIRSQAQWLCQIPFPNGRGKAPKSAAKCWGYAWLRDGLTHKTRSMLNVCMLAALARWHEFEVHVRGALNNGVTAEEIAEILLHTAVYAGIPIASEGFRRADAVIKAVAAEKG